MCSRNNGYWNRMCAQTCGKCTACYTPKTLPKCDWHCTNVKTDAECEVADAVVGICSLEGSPLQRDCLASCGKCKSGLKPCPPGEKSLVAGTIVTSVSVAPTLTFRKMKDGTMVTDYIMEDPDLATNEVAKSAMKQSIATMAGNGVDPSDVVG